MERTSGAPRCPLCGAEMREERGMGRRNAGLVRRLWTCPRCLHRQTTVEEEGDHGVRHPEHPGE